MNRQGRGPNIDFIRYNWKVGFTFCLRTILDLTEIDLEVGRKKKFPDWNRLTCSIRIVKGSLVMYHIIQPY